VALTVAGKGNAVEFLHVSLEAAPVSVGWVVGTRCEGGGREVRSGASEVRVRIAVSCVETPGATAGPGVV
jgi:hypothetical protein